ncbi:MAG: hypothetical protein AAFQ17_02900 [Pseudomonadota bacterium]
MLHDIDLLTEILTDKPWLVNKSEIVRDAYVVNVRAMIDEFFDQDLVDASFG